MPNVGRRVLRERLRWAINLLQAESETIDPPTSADPRMHSCRNLVYYADNYQQSLAKNPFGYRCHANTGVTFPETA